MKRLNRIGWAALCLLGMMSAAGVHGAELETYRGVRWIPDGGNDGDSFLVQLDADRQVRVRLYFVDCPETDASWESDVRRIREQRRYFGLNDEPALIDLGRQAADFTEEHLREPFTVHTAFASALGRSTAGRVYAFVETADGKDLATLLVRNGLARTYGVGRENHQGLRRDEIKARLNDLEASAMLRNVGIWEYSDPEALAELRAAQRQEDTEIQAIRSGIRKSGPEEDAAVVISINTAAKRELQKLPGIGPAIAERIIQKRPFQKPEDLQAVKGISRERVETLRPLIRFE